MAIRIRPWTAISIGIVVVFLGGMIYYLWNFDYHKTAHGAGNNAKVMTRLNIEDYGQRVIVNVSMFNAGDNQLWLADTAKTSPLYDVKLMYRSKPNGAFEPLPLSTHAISEQRQAALDSHEAFSDDNDAVVHLVPGAGLTRSIDLSTLFDPLKPGQYQIAVNYQPAVIADKMGAAFESLGVYSQKISCYTEFQLPMQKAETTPLPPKPTAGSPSILKK